MKTKFFILLIGILPIIGYTQNTKDFQYEELFTEVDTMPYYTGGELELLKFFNNNSDYKFIKKTKDKSFVSLNIIVSKDGKVYNPKILVSTTDELGDEIIRLISLTTWQPGIRKGEKVNVVRNILISTE